jgi:RNA polymerase sigma-70 factor (ECF subfamily)
MSFFSEVAIERSFPSYAQLRASYGFVPNLFRVQSALPRVLDAEVRLLETAVLRDGELSRLLKELLLLDIARAYQNSYCMMLHARALRLLGLAEDRISSFAVSAAEAGPAAAAESALRQFTIKLATHAPWVSGKDFEALRHVGFDDEALLEAVATTALGRCLCTLADGFHPALDEEVGTALDVPPAEHAEPVHFVDTPGPYLRAVPRRANEFPPFAFLQERFGFIPNIFRAQTLRPDIIEAEVNALDTILLSEDGLSRIQKENILLVTSAANLNTYCVAVHSEILSVLGVAPDDADQIVSDHHRAQISEADKVLLDCVSNLTLKPGQFGPIDIERLRTHAFTEAQIVEAVVMCALANFLNILQMGLGSVPDFAPRHVFTPEKMYPSSAELRPTVDAVRSDVTQDADMELVVRAQNGDTSAFEELVRRHTRRIFGTLAGMLGNPDDARDALQDVFLKAFEHIGAFQGRSKFSTWLTSIAINSGTELLRGRRSTESLDEDADDETFRPRQIHGWADNPEQLVSAEQMRALVRQAVRRLPEKYRAAILLRDLNQLSTEDAAAALGLGIPALKARLLRARLMLREALAPHFARAE